MQLANPSSEPIRCDLELSLLLKSATPSRGPKLVVLEADTAGQLPYSTFLSIFSLPLCSLLLSG